MTKSNTPKNRPVQRVEGVLFYIALHEDRWIETIGIPFEHRGRTWAVHRSTFAEPASPALYAVSDVETGRSIGRIMEGSIEAAKAIAIEKINSAAPEQWKEFLQAAQPKQTRSRAKATAA
ncbi:hypothetical protein [Burkholderia sp. Bp9015]|uniref:hypothetical protein n=1 Tax=Burkholderia sp. Bp9015 TaxID=2184563 RepID=UPI000F5A663F|nr:hypothetical protein [Burkholderia sp. Bp9015]RQR62890.1 hypothetical protein DIE12_34470 [Burkholderia sp. Bp9015]